MLFFAIFVTDVDGGLDRDIFDINEGLWIILLFYFFTFLPFLGLLWRHMEVLRLGIELEL